MFQSRVGSWPHPQVLDFAEKTNTLAYYENPLITAVKSVIVQAPGPNVMKLFMAAIYGCLLYARVFVLGKPFLPSTMFTSKAGAYMSECPTLW